MNLTNFPSFQFFNKTIKNIRKNPKALTQIVHPETGVDWLLELEYEKSESEGQLFDTMKMLLEVIASSQGMQDVFKLKAADIYKVKTIKSLER